MRRFNIIIIAVLFSFILAFLCFQYIFSIYEVIYSVTPKELFADNKSTVTITAVPLNSFGRKAPFRTTPAVFHIIDGNELVDITSKDEQNGILTLRAKDKPGVIIIHAKAEKSLLPSSIEIPVQPNIAFK
jgi:hypothetical protein